jgi:riboflavin kinase / FMN adenylyltransferase
VDIVHLDPGRAWEAAGPSRRPVVAVGNFDGVHRGHQTLLQAARDRAARHGGTVVVLTFEPHPARVVSPERAPSRLMTLEQKGEVLAGLGVDVLALLPFTGALAEKTADDFARLVLSECLHAEGVVVGENFRFGRGRAGTLQDLQRLGAELGFATIGVPPVLLDGQPVSSSRVRDALAAGDVTLAASLLGRPYSIEGDVVQGEGRGRTLGVPTANLRPVNETLPALGVYACRCRVAAGEAPRPAVANLGHRPTFGPGETTVEAHVLDFEGDLYGRRLRLEFVDRLRAERAFGSPEALREQIGRDREDARRLLETPSPRGYSL